MVFFCCIQPRRLAAAGQLIHTSGNNVTVVPTTGWFQTLFIILLVTQTYLLTMTYRDINDRIRSRYSLLGLKVCMLFVWRLSSHLREFLHTISRVRTKVEPRKSAKEISKLIVFYSRCRHYMAEILLNWRKTPIKYADFKINALLCWRKF